MLLKTLSHYPDNNNTEKNIYGIWLFLLSVESPPSDCKHSQFFRVVGFKNGKENLKKVVFYFLVFYFHLNILHSTASNFRQLIQTDRYKLIMLGLLRTINLSVRESISNDHEKKNFVATKSISIWSLCDHKWIKHS